jgi:hypothetical protein
MKVDYSQNFFLYLESFSHTRNGVNMVQGKELVEGKT